MVGGETCTVDEAAELERLLYFTMSVCIQGYLSSLSMKAFAYINLDGVITGIASGSSLELFCYDFSLPLNTGAFFPGRNGFKVAASPLMHSLIEGTLNEVKGSWTDRWCVCLSASHTYNRLPPGDVSEPGRVSVFPIRQRQLGDKYVSVHCY